VYYKVSNGMKIYTNSKRVRQARRLIYDLILSDHPKDCLNCERNQNCELQN
jgi:NADH-quinone oxidoreductase subunit G/NADP-reducing hydrogenase subunit HndD